VVTGTWAAFVWASGVVASDAGVGAFCAQIDDTVIIIMAACTRISRRSVGWSRLLEFMV
jgi:hypothetical protein